MPCRVIGGMKLTSYLIGPWHAKDTRENILKKREEEWLQVFHSFKSTALPLIPNSQSNISLAWRSYLDIWRRYCSTSVARQQSTHRVAKNHYSNYIWNARSEQTWLPDKNWNAEWYSKVLTLGVIQMHLTWLYNKPTLPTLACAGGDGIDTAIIQQQQTAEECEGKLQHCNGNATLQSCRVCCNMKPDQTLTLTFWRSRTFSQLLQKVSNHKLV